MKHLLKITIFITILGLGFLPSIESLAQNHRGPDQLIETHRYPRGTYFQDSVVYVYENRLGPLAKFRNASSVHNSYIQDLMTYSIREFYFELVDGKTLNAQDVETGFVA